MSTVAPGLQSSAVLPYERAGLARRHTSLCVLANCALPVSTEAFVQGFNRMIAFGRCPGRVRNVQGGWILSGR